MKGRFWLGFVGACALLAGCADGGSGTSVQQPAKNDSGWTEQEQARAILARHWEGKAGTTPRTRRAVSQPAPRSSGRSSNPSRHKSGLLVGRWKGALDLSQVSKDDPAGKMAEAMAGMLASSLSLEFKNASEFRLSMMGVPIDGDYLITGSKLTLYPKTVLGMTPAQAAKLRKQRGHGGQVDPADLEKPMHGTVSPDGSTIRLVGESKNDGEMVFTRAAPKPTGSATVTRAERALVGDYRIDVERIGASLTRAKDREEFEMAKSMLATSELDLRPDNTFSLSLMVEMSGTWRLNGQRLRLDVKGMMGMEGGKTSGEPLFFDVEDGGRMLTARGSRQGEIMVFVRR